jgi:hypothetical protein
MRLRRDGSSTGFRAAYNATNQRVSQTVSDNSWISYPSGPTATTGYTANSLNQYTCVGVTAPSCAGVVPTYDGNGNLTSDGAYTLGYDAGAVRLYGPTDRSGDCPLLLSGSDVFASVGAVSTTRPDWACWRNPFVWIHGKRPA